jgi:hypothetical protein
VPEIALALVLCRRRATRRLGVNCFEYGPGSVGYHTAGKQRGDDGGNAT